MKKKGLIVIAVSVVFCLNALNCFALADKKPKKEGILLVAFGSSEASAQVSFEKIDKRVKKTYPDIPVRGA